jgi:hypothetical protein
MIELQEMRRNSSINRRNRTTSEVIEEEQSKFIELSEKEYNEQSSSVFVSSLEIKREQSSAKVSSSASELF